MPEVSQKPSSNKYSGIALLTSSIAAYGLLRKGNYRAALLFYPRAGGMGLNLYKEKPNGQLHRLFAIDYHPVKNSITKIPEWKLHYHRGENRSQMDKHRPYEGGW